MSATVQATQSKTVTYVNTPNPIYEVSTKPILNDASTSQMNIKEVFPINRVNGIMKASGPTFLNGQTYDFQVVEPNILWDKSYMYFDVHFANKKEDVFSDAFNAGIPENLVSLLIEEISIKLNKSSTNYFQKSNFDFKTHFHCHSIDNLTFEEVNKGDVFATPFGTNGQYIKPLADSTSAAASITGLVKDRMENYIGDKAGNFMTSWRFKLPFEYFGLKGIIPNLYQNDIRLKFANDIPLEQHSEKGSARVDAADGPPAVTAVPAVPYSARAYIVKCAIMLCKMDPTQLELSRRVKNKTDKVSDILSYIDYDVKRFNLTSNGVQQLNIPSINNLQSVKLLQFNNECGASKTKYTAPNQTFIGNSSHATTLTNSKMSTTLPWNDIRVFYGGLSYPDSPLKTDLNGKFNAMELYQEYLKTAKKSPSEAMLSYQAFSTVLPIVSMSIFDGPKITSKQNLMVQFTNNSTISEDILVVCGVIKTFIINSDLQITESE